jgi:phage shock protein A
MADLLKKIQTLISANLHAMVDSALKANSMAVFDQYVREVEDNLENLQDAVATLTSFCGKARRTWHWLPRAG